MVHDHRGVGRFGDLSVGWRILGRSLPELDPTIWGPVSVLIDIHGEGGPTKGLTRSFSPALTTRTGPLLSLRSPFSPKGRL